MFSRRLVLGLAATLACAPVSVRAQSGGLAERRAIAAYEKDAWPAQQAAIRAAAGFDVAIEVNWPSLALPGYAASYANDDYLRKPIIDPVVKALGAVASDEMGRKALRDKLKGIRIHYDEASAPASDYAGGLRFENGLLTINWKPFSNVDDLDPRAQALTRLLESKL